MIDLTRLRRLVTHDNCMDGLATAMLVREALPDLPITFIQYNTPEHRDLAVEPGLLFCDMTPPRERVREFVAAGAYCLDHHLHARDLVEAFGERGAFADEKLKPGVSGAVLAYNYITLQGSAIILKPRFAVLAGIRDTWQKDSLEWQSALELHAVLEHYPREYWLEGGGLRPVFPIEYALQLSSTLGPMLLRDKARRVESVLSKGMLVSDSETSAVRWGFTATRSELVSDLAEAARQLPAPVHVLVNCHLRVQDGQVCRVFSLRSDGSVDVGRLAKHYGGGGHSRAAGFSTSSEGTSAKSWLLHMQSLAEELVP